ncbi:MAG: transporter [Halieaceae bacterium]|nr:transporter [Halieaceae bacterium]
MKRENEPYTSSRSEAPTSQPLLSPQPALRRAIAVTLLAGLSASTAAQDDIAQQLANPIASLISLPLQLNYDDNYGAADRGSVTRLNVQPVIPMSLNDDWNLISRTILPVIDQQDLFTGGGSEFGLGDTVQSLFFSPRAPTASGWIWGVGPVALLPTATDERLGGEQWGAGPTAVALRQSGAWTYGALANHIESFAGDSDRADISASFVQPFVTYITPGKTTIAFNTESTYDWEAEQWSVPLNFNVLQLLKAGNQLMQVGGGFRYWVDGPDNGPEGWGFRLILTFVFPR